MDKLAIGEFILRSTWDISATETQYETSPFFSREGTGIESCNLIGSSCGPGFSFSAHGHGNAMRICCRWP